MSNYEDNDDKLTSRLEDLEIRHRKLDEEIKEMYIKFEKDEIINRLKTQKLWLKDEIHRIQTKLADKNYVNGSS